MLAAIERISHGALRLAGARSLHVDTSVARVHGYELRGRGRGTFVLLHGMGTTSTSYLQVALKLARHAERVLLPDLPGHGRSERVGTTLDRESLSAAMLEALDRWILERDPAVVLGTSLGGATAIGYALERPERVKALVLASPAGAPLSERELTEVRTRFDLRTREDARRFLGELLHHTPFYFRLLEPSLVEQLGSETVQGFLGNVKAEDFFTAEQLGSIQCPVHVLWGQSDRILPRSSLAFLRDALPPGTRFEEPSALGHSPHLERPDLLVERLVRARG
jgi:pimeloyl-ACP methyl ester carboxylesterase